MYEINFFGWSELTVPSNKTLDLTPDTYSYRCSESAGQRLQTTAAATTKESNVTLSSFPLLDAAKFETRARRTDNAAVLVKGQGDERGRQEGRKVSQNWRITFI